MGADVQIACKGGLPRQGGYQKIPQDVLLLEHGKAAVEELGQDDEVDCDIVLGGGQDLMVHRLVEKEQVPGLEHHLLGAVDDVGGGAAAHIDQFHIVVPVARKMNEPGVGAYLDQFALFQQAGAVHHELVAGGVQAALDGAVPCQDGAFLIGDLAQPGQKSLVHGGLLLLATSIPQPGRHCKKGPCFYPGGVLTKNAPNRYTCSR